MNSRTLRLVLLVSCCHALVHVYELSLASVEQLVAADYGVGTQVTGPLGTTLRMPFGLGALAAGWLAGHFGAKRLLLVYLLGCSLAACLAAVAPGLAGLFAAMFLMGSFASIYHPAGLGLIAHHTTPENRPMALGYHGIFGSAGIAAAPFIAAIVLDSGLTWWQYYLVLAVPGVLLAGLLGWRLPHEEQAAAGLENGLAAGDEDTARWGAFAILLVLTMSAGFVYHAVLNFLPRYLHEAGLNPEGTGSVAHDNYLTGVVLALGILGQYGAGRIARHDTLERLLTFIFLGVAAALFWMALAAGPQRLWSACLFATLFFMHQPVFNSLVAKYVARRQRSLAYGVSFTLGFGVGSLGSTFAGFTSDFVNHITLGAVSLWVVILAAVLWWKSRRSPGVHTPGN
ncbi:MAG: MFS transporter [Rhodopirellula sp.]|nr:MFS transporter [Rhodopirellula sp.]